MDLTPEDGTVSGSPLEDSALRYADYTKCDTPDCGFHYSPQTREAIIDNGGYYTCPSCHLSHDAMNYLPWHGAPADKGVFTSGHGGGTKIGLKMTEQGQIGEDLIRDQEELPGYGRIVWWHDGGTAANSPLDGATRDWGIEVKTIGYDSLHHRFIPGRKSEKEKKNLHAKSMGLKGILGVLVVLDYRNGIADVYVKEMPLDPWITGSGRTVSGITAFRKHNGTHLLERIPFKNPFSDSSNPDPIAEQAVPF